MGQGGVEKNRKRRKETFHCVAGGGENVGKENRDAGISGTQARAT